LGILFSNKAFPSRVLGLAWKGDPKKQSGICQKRRREVQGPIFLFYKYFRQNNWQKISVFCSKYC
jgi:hypothetical protein